MPVLSEPIVTVRQAGRPVHSAGRLGEGWPVWLSYQLPDENGDLQPVDLDDYTLTVKGEVWWGLFRPDDDEPVQYVGRARVRSDPDDETSALTDADEPTVSVQAFRDQNAARGQYHVIVDKDSIPVQMRGIRPDARLLPCVIYSVTFAKQDDPTVDVVMLTVAFRFGPESMGVEPSAVYTVGGVSGSASGGGQTGTQGLDASRVEQLILENVLEPARIAGARWDAAKLPADVVYTADLPSSSGDLTQEAADARYQRHRNEQLGLTPTPAQAGVFPDGGAGPNTADRALTVEEYDRYGTVVFRNNQNAITSGNSETNPYLITVPSSRRGDSIVFQNLSTLWIRFATSGRLSGRARSALGENQSPVIAPQGEVCILYTVTTNSVECVIGASDVDGHITRLVSPTALATDASRWGKLKLPADTVYTNSQRFTTTLQSKLAALPAASDIRFTNHPVATAAQLNALSTTTTSLDFVTVTASITSGITISVVDANGNALSSLARGDVLVLDHSQSRFERVVNLPAGATLPAEVTKAEAEAGTGTAGRIWTPQRVKEAIAALETNATATAALLNALSGAARLDYNSLKNPPTIPAEQTGAGIVTLLEGLSAGSRLSYTALDDGLSGAGIVTLLAGLTGADRLSYNNLKDTPSASSGGARFTLENTAPSANTNISTGSGRWGSWTEVNELSAITSAQAGKVLVLADVYSARGAFASPPRDVAIGARYSRTTSGNATTYSGATVGITPGDMYSYDRSVPTPFWVVEVTAGDVIKLHMRALISGGRVISQSNIQRNGCSLKLIGI